MSLEPLWKSQVQYVQYTNISLADDIDYWIDALHSLSFIKDQQNAQVIDSWVNYVE